MKSQIQPTKTRGKARYLRYFIYLVPILLFVLGYATITVVTGETNPFTIVTGTSMQPTIVAGSVAMISKVPFDQLKVGDVIVFVPQLAERYSCDSGPAPSLTSEVSVPCYVIHRIVAIQVTNGQRTLMTKGDNNAYSIPTIDYPINQTMYIGKVVLQLPAAGYLAEPPYNELIAALILGLLIGEFYWDRKQPAKNLQLKDGSQSAPPAA